MSETIIARIATVFEEATTNDDFKTTFQKIEGHHFLKEISAVLLHLSDEDFSVAKKLFHMEIVMKGILGEALRSLIDSQVTEESNNSAQPLNTHDLQEINTPKSKFRVEIYNIVRALANAKIQNDVRQ